MDLAEFLRQELEPLLLDLLYRMERLEMEGRSPDTMPMQRLPALKTAVDQDVALALLKERVELLERRSNRGE